jgi:hypothetical protein
VEEKHISLDTLDDVAGLVKTMLDILPKAQFSSHKASGVISDMKPPSSSTIQGTQLEHKDPVENMKTWPSQEKRETRKSRIYFLYTEC